jgi:Ca2+-binding RTX toxin-like protein
VRGGGPRDVVRRRDQRRQQPQVIRGGDGNDLLDGGGGIDLLSGQGGDDSITSRDGRTDVVSCGGGTDSVTADPRDVVARDCESVTRSRA